MIKLAIILSHPIQYYSPLFRQLAKSEALQIKVFYSWNPKENANYDPGFNKSIEWDIPLLEGYDYTFSKNVSKDPGTHHYFGLDNPELINEIISWKADTLLVYGWKYKTNLQILKHFKGKKTIFFRGDSHLIDDIDPLKRGIRNLILKWVYRKIDYAFYVGKNNKDYFINAGLSTRQLIWAPHSIENKRFAEDNKTRSEEADRIRDQMGITKEDIIILFAGKLEAKKQPLQLLDIARNSYDPKIHFLFAGNGEFDNEIKTSASTCNNIHYLPFQNQTQMPVLYRVCDIFCLPSKKEETWGLAVNEAMACAKPVIASNKVGCAVDLIRNGENGFIYAYDDKSELENIINSVSGKKEMLFEMGQRSKAIIENWSIEEQANRIKEGILAHVKDYYEYQSSGVIK